MIFLYILFRKHQQVIIVWTTTRDRSYTTIQISIVWARVKCVCSLLLFVCFLSRFWFCCCCLIVCVVFRLSVCVCFNLCYFVLFIFPLTVIVQCTWQSVLYDDKPWTQALCQSFFSRITYSNIIIETNVYAYAFMRHRVCSGLSAVFCVRAFANTYVCMHVHFRPLTKLR